MRTRLIRTALILILAGIAGPRSVVEFSAPEGALELRPATAIDASPIRAKYSFYVTSGRVFELSLGNNGSSLHFSLLEPGGQTIRSISCTNEGKSRMTVFAPKSGAYTLFLERCSPLESKIFPYTVLLAEPRDATSNDHKSVKADALTYEGDALTGEYREVSSRTALTRFDEAVQLWESIGDAARVTKILLAKTQLLRELGQSELATATAQQGLDNAMLHADYKGQGNSYLTLALMSAHQGNTKLAEQYCNRALEIAISRSDEDLEASARFTIGTVYYEYNSEYDRATEAVERARSIWLKFGNHLGAARAMAYRAAIDFDQSRFDSAPKLALQSLGVFRTLGERRYEARTLILIGYNESRLGRSQEAINRFLEAEPIVVQSGDLDWNSALSNQLGTVYRDLGDHKTSLQLFQSGLDTQNRLGDSAGIAIGLFLVGRAHFDADNISQAVEYFNRSYSAFETLENKRFQAIVLNYLGAAYAEQAQPAAANKAFQEMLNLSMNPKVADQRLESSAWIGLGHLQETSGQNAKALESFKRARELSNAALDPGGEVTSLYHIASVQRTMGDFRSALATSNVAIQLIEERRATVVSAEWRSSYFASVRQQYELQIDTLMRMYQQSGDDSFLTQAFETSERSRARTLLDHIAETRDSLLAGEDPKLLEREKRLSGQLDALKAKYNGAADDARVALFSQIQDLSRQREELETQITSRSPHYASLVQPQPLKIKSIREQLDRNSLILEYSLGETSSYLFVLDSETPLTRYVLPGRREIASQVAQFRKLVTVRQTTQDRNDIVAADKEFVRAAEKLGGVLVGQVAPRLGKKRLVIIADGILQSVPFSALPATSGSGVTNQLTLDHEIVNLPSASSLAQLRVEASHRKTPGRMLAVFADPVYQDYDARLLALQAALPASSNAVAQLQVQASDSKPLSRGDGLSLANSLPRLDGTAAEATAILKFVSANNRMEATGFRANKAAALNPDLSQYRYIHFAAHSIMNDDYPELSSIVLSLFDEHRKSQDGYLWLKDMYNLRLSADLVVLSACDTGLGKEVKGEGLMSMVRGFMYSGTPRVIASLWKVDDKATAELMTEFYRQLLENHRTPAEALRLAQNFQRSKPDRQSPYYWAAFQLHGEWN